MAEPCTDLEDRMALVIRDMGAMLLEAERLLGRCEFYLAELNPDVERGELVRQVRVFRKGFLPVVMGKGAKGGANDEG